MAKVILKRNFFATGGRRFKKSAGPWDPRVIPDELCFDVNGKSLLPKDAVVVDGPVAPAPVEPEGNLLRAADVDRAAGEEAAKVVEAAEEDEAAEFKRKLEREQQEAAAPVTKNRKPKK